MAFPNQAQGNGPQGGAAGPDKGRYDTATNTFRKSAKKQGPGGEGKGKPDDNSRPGKAGKSKSGFTGKTSTVRPLTPQEHQAAADHLAAVGQHVAAAHHRAAADGGQAGGSDNDGD